MKKGNKTFAAIFKDGSFVEKEWFEEVSILTTAFFFLKIEFYKEHTTSYGNTYKYFWFKPMNLEGKPTSIEIGNFKILDVGPEDGTYYPKGIEMKILAVNENIVYDYKTEKNGLSCFKDEIFPLLHKLNELGSWSNYLIFKKALDEEKQNKELKQKIDDLKMQVEKLLIENKELKLKLKNYQK